jgi:hypothetical protein
LTVITIGEKSKFFITIVFASCALALLEDARKVAPNSIVAANALIRFRPEMFVNM